MENEMNVNVPLEVVKASEIEPKEVKWLWYPYIPFGKVTLLQGDPGDGKSKLMLSIAALLSKGEALPFTDEETEPILSDSTKPHTGLRSSRSSPTGRTKNDKYQEKRGSRTGLRLPSPPSQKAISRRRKCPPSRTTT